MDNALKSLYKSATSEQRLSILRMEMVKPVSTIRGYIALIQKNYGSSNNQSDEFKEWIAKIAGAADYLKDLLDELN